MAHLHDAEHASPPKGSLTRRSHEQKALRFVLLLAATYMGAEIVGGILTNSLALLADAGHMLSDVASLALSLFAGWIATRPPSPHKTYGYYRAEILAALANGATLVVVAIIVAVEAVRRLRAPPEVGGAMMFTIAGGGLLVNLVGLWVLRGHDEGNLNVRAAWLHVLGDAAGSVGAMVAGSLVWSLGWNLADPIASALIALLIAWSAWSILRQGTSVLMESAPGSIDVDQLRNAMLGVPGVCTLHDLHVWSITSGMNALSAHVVLTGTDSSRSTLQALRTLLAAEFRLDHVTLQIEDVACAAEDGHP